VAMLLVGLAGDTPAGQGLLHRVVALAVAPLVAGMVVDRAPRRPRLVVEESLGVVVDTACWQGVLGIVVGSCCCSGCGLRHGHHGRHANREPVLGVVEAGLPWT
jgi:hypothetical protein